MGKYVIIGLTYSLGQQYLTVKNGEREIVINNKNYFNVKRLLLAQNPTCKEQMKTTEQRLLSLAVNF